MTNDVFSTMYDKLLGIFDSPPRPAAKAAVWDVCEPLPDLMADFVIQQAWDLDKKPGNLPKFVRFCWFRWRESRPDMAAQDQEFGCPKCSKGVIHYVLHRTGYGWIPGTATCGYCRPSGQTYENIQKFGGEVVSPGAALSICAERNAKQEVPAMGENFTAKLEAWKKGHKPYERAVPDDEKPQSDSWWQ